jgi:hypothetical protein
MIRERNAIIANQAVKSPFSPTVTPKQLGQ